MIRELICWACTCAKCKHSWTTKTHDLPKFCVKCKTQKWNEDYDPIEVAEDVQPVAEIPMTHRDKLDTLRAMIAPIENGEPSPFIATPDEYWIDDPITFENGEILYWHHKPKCKPVCYRRESDISGA